MNTEFEKWLRQYRAAGFSREAEVQAAYLAGQASVEHEWTLKYDKLFDEAVDWREASIINKGDIAYLRTKCAELERECDRACEQHREVARKLYELKAQAGEPVAWMNKRGDVISAEE